MAVRSFGPSIGYHGCDQETANAVLVGANYLLIESILCMVVHRIDQQGNEHDWT